MRWLTLIAALLIGSTAGATPCSKVSVSAGEVRADPPLQATAPLPAREAACAADLGARLARRKVRSLTVAVRLDDRGRAAGDGSKIGAAWRSALVAAGLPEARVDVVTPATDAAHAGTVALTFVERRKQRLVAVVEATIGRVRVEGDGAETDVAVGTRLPARAVVRTGPESRATLALADGSRVRLMPKTELGLGKVALNAQLERVVELELWRGRIETTAAPRGAGSLFDVRTPYGVAGVRGTVFRATVGEEKSTRLETLEGQVALSAKAGEVTVDAGFWSAVDASGVPTPPRPLPGAPQAVSPLRGEHPADGHLRWRAAPRATGYRVEIAPDPEFVYGVRTFEATATALPLPKLEPGKWYWRIAAMDADGAIGQPSRVYAVQLR